MPPLHYPSLEDRLCLKISTRAKLPWFVRRTEQVLIVIEEEEVAIIRVFVLWVMAFEIFALVAVDGKVTRMRRMTIFLGMGDCLPRIGKESGREICRWRDAWQTAVCF